MANYLGPSVEKDIVTWSTSHCTRDMDTEETDSAPSEVDVQDETVVKQEMANYLGPSEEKDIVTWSISEQAFNLKNQEDVQYQTVQIKNGHLVNYVAPSVDVQYETVKNQEMGNSVATSEHDEIFRWSVADQQWMIMKNEEDEHEHCKNEEMDNSPSIIVACENDVGDETVQNEQMANSESLLVGNEHDVRDATVVHNEVMDNYLGPVQLNQCGWLCKLDGMWKIVDEEEVLSLFPAAPQVSTDAIK